jgi:hypothetical protein
MGDASERVHRLTDKVLNFVWAAEASMPLAFNSIGFSARLIFSLLKISFGS